MQLIITVIFTSGRYHGRGEDKRLDHWPPSPSRLFQALIAGSHRGAYGLINQDIRDRALHWLERLDPPVINTCPVVESGRGLKQFLPNNDDQINHVKSAENPMSAWVLTGDRTLIYQWKTTDTDEAKENAPVICAMARLMTSLGDVQDTIYARGEMVNHQSPSIQSTEERIVYQPQPQTDGNWESPDVGSLIGYQNRYRSMLQAATREFSPAAINYPVKSRRVHYSTQEIIRSDAPMALFELWRNEDERLPYDPRDLRQPAAMVRHTMIEWLETHPAFRNRYGAELTSRLIAGHESDKQHSTQFNGAHIACVPIPTMKEEGVYDGLIRRVLLIGFGCEEKETVELFESVTNGINGAALKDQSVKVGYLKRTSLNDSVLRLFTRKAYRVWRTVTPIILTGLMRRGRGAEVLIARALKQAGLNENDIESIATFSGPIVPKTVHALDYRIDKNSYLAQAPRYHAEVIFKRPVIGPLVVGRGRHSGFGLMMPCLEKPTDNLK